MAEDRLSALVWFRNDLRLSDNPALTAALATGQHVRAIFVHETDPTLRPIGAAARWWLEQSLASLSTDLAAHGIALEVVEGHSAIAVPERAQHHGTSHLFWNRRYAPAERELDREIEHALREDGVEVATSNGTLLVEPTDIASGSGKPYSVFTPFWKALRQREMPAPLPKPARRSKATTESYRKGAQALPKWSEKLASEWRVGEAAAQRALHRFLDHRLSSYEHGRDIPSRDDTSRLSPHLRFGEISPRQIWQAAQALSAHDVAGADKFMAEIAWREFAYHLLYHRDDIASVPMQARFANTQWLNDSSGLHAWQRGRTGIPIVDAGMRQLWATGWMHNRVRMLTASLLAKNLLIDWRLGERWFWDTLVDADGANNPVNWQWVAGCGADAAPYFRVFNPVTQGEKFDPDGAYVRHWVPELAALPDRWIHRPSEAPADVLRAAKITLGATYPRPIVDLKSSRERALSALAAR